MRTLDRHDDGRSPAMDVTLARPVVCVRCGAETTGAATCVACFQALDELRGLAADPRPRRDEILWLSDRVADLR